jgi:FtsH-binding integral membrane protein
MNNQNNNSSNSSNTLGKGHSFQNYMSKVWLIGLFAAFVSGIAAPILILNWFYGKDFWKEYGILKILIKSGQWRYFNFLNIQHSAVMLAFYFLIENIILLEIIFIYAAYKIVKAEEKRHINIEAKYQEKVSSETKDKNFNKEEKQSKTQEQNNDKFKLE